MYAFQNSDEQLQCLSLMYLPNNQTKDKETKNLQKHTESTRERKKNNTQRARNVIGAS